MILKKNFTGATPNKLTVSSATPFTDSMANVNRNVKNGLL